MISLMIVLLTLIPAWLIVPNMTDLGRPALIVGMLLFVWWVVARLNPRLVLLGPQPMRWAVFGYLMSMLVSYPIGLLRGLTTIEANSADRALLSAAVFVGVILMAADGLPNWARMKSVLQVFVWCCSMMAVIGLLQFILYMDVTQFITVPGLEAKGWVPELEIRGSGIRVASTTSHYIEFSTIMAIALPFAIHFAVFSDTRLRRQLFAVAALCVAAAVPATMSRTGFIGLAIVILVMLPIWGWRMRYNLLALGTCMVAAMIVAKPAVWSTINGMFAGAADDPSITARTKRYEMVNYYFAQRPWFGRGTGTWVWPQYQYLDNQWLATALTNGLVGVGMLAALHLTGVVLALIAMRRSTTYADRHLCAALVAAQLVGMFVGVTFDSFSFSSYVMVLSLMLGLCGTVWRFTHPKRQVRTSAPWLGRVG
ncbi:O-antigen ligase family protein [Solwaraspora sp. WMMD791]|uniref:O-antigen ligase family protein n=1 Tax=Solwaraspora sp. WMMD791 TaxID=3016086 RepID=UPI00249A2F8C|nr:O-antigen ligase family protein [Solwaraspora sp. WMMD791]WFE30198.1 O-antigen ligase family protein [Solwaraspora sp. WMMD791]